MYEASSSDPPPAYNEIVQRIEAAGLSEDLGFLGMVKLSGDELAEEFLDEENILKIERELYIRKQIEHNYPINYIIVDSILIIVMNVTLIVMQIVAMQYNAALSGIASGVWAGLYNLLAVVLVLLTSTY
jgi:hypothetical protein